MTSTVFAMVLSAALLHAIWNALVKVHGDRLVVMAMITVSAGIISVFALPFVAFPAPAAWPYIWGSLILHNAYYLFLVMAYRYGDLSHVYPLARGSAPLIVAGLSVALVGESLTRQGFLSVGIISLGVMSLTLTRGASGFREPRAVLFALGTGCFIGAVHGRRWSRRTSRREPPWVHILAFRDRHNSPCSLCSLATAGQGVAGSSS